MSDQFRTRMRNQHRKTTATMVITDPRQPIIGEAENVTKEGEVLVSQPSFTVPPPGGESPPMTLAQLVALTKGGDVMPMPVSRDLTAQEREALLAGQAPSSRLTQTERETLIYLGWQEGDPIPPDFSEEVHKVFSEYAAKEQAKCIDLSKIPISRIEDLPPEERQRLSDSLKSMAQSMQPSGQGAAAVRQTMEHYTPAIQQALAGVDFTPVTESQPPQPQAPTPSQTKPEPQQIPEPKPESKPESKPADFATRICNTCGHNPNAAKKRLTCFHCGCNPLDDPNVLEISIEDKRAFLISLGTRRPFEKEYKLFNDTITVRFRAMRSNEIDPVLIWSVRAAAKELQGINPDIRPTQETLRDRALHKELLGCAAIQTVSLASRLETGDLFWAAPQCSAYPTLQDWEREYGIATMDDLIGKFLEEVHSEAILMAVQYQLSRFNLLHTRLGQEAMNTQNFWKET
jgi:hypothetical protein